MIPPPDSTPLALVYAKMRELIAEVAALGNGWSARESIAGKLASGFTANPTFDIRRNGPDREIRAMLDGSFTASGTVNIVTTANALPADDRPTGASVFAFAYMSGGNPGSAFVRTDGSIAVANMTATARTTTQFTLRYTVAS